MDNSDLDRRQLLALGGSVLGAVGLGLTGCSSKAGSAAASASTATSAAATASSVCVLTSEMTQGPYYLDDSIVEAVTAVAPYTRHTGSWTKLGSDMVYTGGGVKDGLLTVSGSAGGGYTATITVGVDPNSTSGSGGGGQPAG
ncbi:hypothetical protein GCM10010193_40640 [Kitasatospora atroaurantiaca]|uniref:Uncharacterized protein n=1 Tax=Kitasatospora atroaurantiaca TaxID=285545 RepID=A0A561F1G0_9ACTN|nr:hypothetical protein [Kitasatospora atroaurantiaca]TWE21705.1 hypothetical protein FB465_6905 [Kitasatospora atroaurantiaca]